MWQAGVLPNSMPKTVESIVFLIFIIGVTCLPILCCQNFFGIFFIDTLNVLFFSPWGFIIFISVYTLPTWGTALVTFLDESGLQFIGDAIEFFIVSQSYQNRRDPEDYSDLPELVGDNDENCDSQNDNIHIVDEHVYHPVYGVMSKSMLIQWGEWPLPTVD